jgi:hypothetical protein
MVSVDPLFTAIIIQLDRTFCRLTIATANVLYGELMLAMPYTRVTILGVCALMLASKFHESQLQDGPRKPRYCLTAMEVAPLIGLSVKNMTKWEACCFDQLGFNVLRFDYVGECLDGKMMRPRRDAAVESDTRRRVEDDIEDVSSDDEHAVVVVTRTMEDVARDKMPDYDVRLATFMAQLVMDSADTVSMRKEKQGSDEWMKIRSYRITGSVAGDWMGYNRFSSQHQAIRKLLHKMRAPPNEHMKRGTRLEPVARQMFVEELRSELRSEHPEWTVECVEDGLCVVDDPDMYCFGYSPDGRVIITDRATGKVTQQLLEIKAPAKGFYPQIPPSYMAQMQMGMELLRQIFDPDGFTLCYFVQIHDGAIKTEVVKYNKHYTEHMMTELARLWIKEFIPRVLLKKAGYIRGTDIFPYVDCDEKTPVMKSSLPMYNKKRRVSNECFT